MSEVPAAAPLPVLTWEVAGLTDQGRVRGHNEDALLLVPDCGLVCVCDGMGGHASGEVASGLAVETIAGFFRYAFGDPDATWPFKLDRNFSREANRLSISIRLAAGKIYERAAANEQQRGMGTTIVACTLGPQKVAVGHAGDSRCYLFRGGVLSGVTRDHSLLQEYIAARGPSAEEIAAFPHKNVITRALGLDPNVRPEVNEFDAQQGDVLMLCSDGLHGMITDVQIAEILASERDLTAAAAKLIAGANAAGGVDNITVALARAA